MTAPERRCFRFSLRTMFVVVTVMGGWLGYCLNWIRERHAALDDRQVTFMANPYSYPTRSIAR